MNALQFPLAAIGDDGIEVDATLRLSDLQPAGAADLPMAQVRLRGQLEQIDAELLFRGRLEAEYTQPCDRCLEELPFTLQLEVMWAGAAEALAGDAVDAFAEEAGSPEIPVHDGMADLGPCVWEELVLGVPMKHVYPADAAGKCSACGRDVQRALATSGDAVDSGTESKFAQLADLYRELKNTQEE